MKLSLDNIGKRFKFHWIFRNVNLEIHSGQTLAVKGPNGSGKSTLLKIISGFLSPSEGSVVFRQQEKELKDFYNKVTYAAPYIDLIGQMTLKEHLAFHHQFKAFKNNLQPKDILKILELTDAADKQIKDFSSGMKQRVRLGISVLSESDLCILDEPSTNLDTDGFDWYKDLLRQYQHDSAFIIASNEERDFVDQIEQIDIRDFKS